MIGTPSEPGRAFKRASIVGGAAVAMAIVLTLLFPMTMGPLPEGMKTPILAFELARSTDEVEAMFGSPASTERATWRAAMDRGNLADFGFLVLYGAYFVLFSRALSQLEQQTRGLALLARIAWLPALMDVLENLQLLAISKQLGGDFSVALSRLQWFTWGKWLLIALLLTLWMRSLWRLGLLGQSAALNAGLTAIFSVLAFFVRGSAAELMGLGTSITIILTWIVGMRLLRRDASSVLAPSP